MKKDLIFASIGIFIGSLLAYYVNFSLYISLALLGLSLVLYLGRDRSFYCLALFFSLGVLLMGYHESNQVLKDYSSGLIKGQIEEIISSEEDYSTYKIKVKNIDNNYMKENALISFKKDTDLEIGDNISSWVRIEGIHDEGNPGLFNYKTYARIDGIYTRMEGYEYSYLFTDTSIFYRIKNNFHKYIREEMKRGLEEDNSKFMVDVLTTSNTIDEEMDNTFTSLGLAHILAVSGLHISIIAGLFALIFERLGFYKYFSNIILILILGLYISLIGYPASAIRAFIMFSLSLMATMLNRAYSPAKALSLSAFLMVLLNPYRVFDLGLILSSLAIIGINNTSKIFSSKRQGPILEGLKTSFVVNLFLFPFLIDNFNVFNLVTFLANIVIVPIFNLAVLAGVLKLLSSLFSNTLSLLLSHFTNQALNIIRYLCDLFLGLDFLSLKFESVGIMFYIIYYFLIIVYMNRHKIKDLSLNFKEKVLQTFSINLSLLFLTLIILDPLVIRFIDIGQADSILIESYRDDLMIDTGGSIFSDSDYTYTLRPYLMKNTCKPVDVIISHDDIDHSGNLAYMVEDGFVKNVYTSAHYKKPYQIGLKEGDILKIGKGYMEVLYDGYGAQSSNDSSLILKLNHYGNTILFTGDGETYAESMVMDKDIGSDVLKVGHHGSASSTSPWFLEKVDPSQAVISVARDNSYGHPDQAVVDRIVESGADLYRTDLDGQVRLISTRFGYSIDSYLPRSIKIEGLMVKILLLGIFSYIYYRYYKVFYMENSLALID